MIILVLLAFGVTQQATQIDYQDEIDKYEKLYVCAYLAKYQSD